MWTEVRFGQLTFAGSFRHCIAMLRISMSRGVRDMVKMSYASVCRRGCVTE